MEESEDVSNNTRVQPRVKHLRISSETEETEELKISQDKLDSEKIMSFVSVGAETGGRGGVSITFSDRNNPRRDVISETPSSPSASSSQDCIQSQLAAVKLKLEQKRKKIEDEKKKMELLMSKQREKVGQEAFLRAVAKGMERPGSGVKEVENEQERKPFILNQGNTSKVGTPDFEKNTLDLYQLQKGLQRMSTNSKQMSSPQHQHEPFYINQPAPPPQQQQQQQQQPSLPQQQPIQPAVHPYYMYPSHPPPPPWFGMMPYAPHPHPYYPGYPPPHPQILPQQQQQQPQQQQQTVQSPVAPDKPAPLTDKPSLSSSFLEMKRRQFQSDPSQSPSHQELGLSESPSSAPSCHSTPVKQSLSASFRAKQRQSLISEPPRTPVSKEKPSSQNNSQHEVFQPDSGHDKSDHGEPCNDATDNAIVDASPPLVLTQSTIDTLNNMTTENIKSNEEDLCKGFVISFGAETVKPKPVLRPRQASITKLEKETVTRDSSTISSPVSNKDSLISTKESSPILSKVSTVNCDTVSPSSCLVCNVRKIDTSAPGGKLCNLCSKMLIKINSDPNPEITEACDGIGCGFNDERFETWCKICWRQSAKIAGVLKRTSGSEEDNQKQREWVEMMSEKRRQQAEDARLKREEEVAKRREEEMLKKEELLRKKEEDKKRREAIFEAYKLKKEADKLKEEGMNYFSSRPPVPKLRPKSAGGNRMKPRPNTIHVDNRENDVTGSHNNINMYRSLTRGESSFRRGSNVSLHDGGSGWSGSGSSEIRSLSMFSRSKSSSASNLGPASLQLGMRSRRSRDDDDNCSEVSSTTSGYTSGRGSARLYREPVSKTNRPIILNAVEYVVLPGEVNKDTRMRVMEEIEKCDCPHFLILFRDSKLQFRALYAYYPDTEEVFKIHGVGPRQVTDKMMDSYFKYNSGGKKFTQIHTKHLTATIDAFTIHNSLWLGKKTKLPDKEMALVV